MKITFLGTGTSQGVPVIACKCEVCLSKNLKDKRLRSSVLIEFQNKTIVIDTGPDFRQQMLRESVEKLDAVLFTHAHKDHVAGLDDIRSFNFRSKKPMDIFCTNDVLNALRMEYSYIFSEKTYPGVPKVNVNIIEKNNFYILKSKEKIQIPLIAAGGIATGKGMLAAMVLGADGVQIGSRFVASEESSAHINFKNKVIEAKDGDTLLTLKELAPVRLLKNKFSNDVLELYKKNPSKQDLIDLLGRARAKKGMFEGDLEDGELEIGQITGLINQIQPASAIIKEIIAEFNFEKENLKDFVF